MMYNASTHVRTQLLHTWKQVLSCVALYSFGNYAGICMSFKNVFICRNQLKQHTYVNKILFTWFLSFNFLSDIYMSDNF